MKYDYLIVGAGLFGAVFCHEAIQRGKRCLVIDKRGHIGGNVYTKNERGINVHKYGAHIFHTGDAETWNYINRFADFNNFINSPVAIYKGELYNLPFNMNTFNKLWGVITPKEAIEKIEKDASCLNIGEPKNLEEQALALVGADVYEKLIRGYTEKQWGKPCKDLPASIIKRLPLRYTYDNNYFRDRYQGIPIGGYTAIIEKLLQGADVELNTDYLECKELFTSMCSKTIYTGPIDSYFNLCYGELEYRSLKFEEEWHCTKNYQGCAVVNYTERDIPYTRIIEHKHFEFTDSDSTVITREYPCDITIGKEPYYPVNTGINNELYQKYRALAKNEKTVLFGGRLGTYKYMDMDITVRTARECAKREFG